MPTTPVQGLPYPALSDPANGPVALQNLALALEAGKTIVTCTSTTRPAHLEGRMLYETDTKRLMVSNAGAWQEYGYANAPRGQMDMMKLTAQTGTIGDQVVSTLASNAPNYPANRRLRITVNISCWTGQANTGMVCTFRRWPVTGGTFGTAQVVGGGDGRYWVGSTTQTDGFTFNYEEIVPSAGQWAYGFRAQGHLANAAVIGAGTTIWVDDMGSA